MSNRLFKIAVLPGDGIGEDITAEAIRVLDVLKPEMKGVQFELDYHSVGASEFLKNGDPFPSTAFEAAKNSDAVLLGAMGLPKVRWPDGREMAPQLDLREQLDLYAGIRPIYLYHENDTPLKNQSEGSIDILIVRESTEGLFSTRLNEREPGADEVKDTMLVTRKGSERIIRVAFEEAMKRRKKVSLIEKSNVLPSMVFFNEIFFEIAKEYPEVEADAVYVDAASLFLVQDPSRFDVLVTENMFGDILSDLAAGIVGGMGMAPSADIGDHGAVFQPAHGSAPDIAGKNIANPVATILSLALLLEWLGLVETKAAGLRIRNAVRAVFQNPDNRTPDMKGKLSTSQITDLIIENL
ncbi:MAG: isocitrate/isopropylmalate dehydrogenase family protein [Opitutales bacterium]|nr:isocitrate/isopropylmalate dehydrogenase family protein [Opitutales bacterium]